RRPAAAGLFVLLPVAVILGTLGAAASWLWQRAEDANTRLAGEQAQTLDALKREGEAHQLARAARGREREALEKLAELSYSHRISLAWREWQDARVAHARDLLLGCERARRGWEWHYLNRVFHRELKTLRGHADVVMSVAYSRDGKRLASTSFDHTVKIWDG